MLEVPRKGWLPGVATLLLLAAVATFILWFTHGWAAIGVPHFDPLLEPFSDAYAVLWGPEACAAGKGEWVGGVCFSPSFSSESRAVVYEPWLTFFRWGLGREHLLLLSAMMITLFYLAIGLTLKPAGAREFLMCVLLLASPAVQLGVERANFDLLICAMICLAAWLLGNGRTVAALAGCLVLALATMLKIYTGLACALAWVVARRQRTRVLIAALCGTMLAIAVLGPQAIAVLSHGAPEGTTRYSTGAHWLLRQRGPVAAGIAVFLAAILTGTGLATLRKAPPPRFDAWPNRSAAFDVAFLVAIPLFFLKDSYDYRLVLWLPCLALPLAWLRGGVGRNWRALAVVTLVLYLLTAGMELPCYLIDKWARGTHPGGAATAVSALIYVKQAAAWLLVGALSLIFGFGLVQKISAIGRSAWSR